MSDTMSNVALRADVVGVPVDGLSMDQVVDEVLRWTDDAGAPPRVAVGVNANVCNLAATNAQFRSDLLTADLFYADGQSIVWAAGALGHPIPGRSATTDLIGPLVERGAAQGKRFFLFGGAPGVAAAAAERLAASFPEFSRDVSHGYVPEGEMEALVERINASGADILLVGLGDPLQQQWVRRYRDRLTVPAVLTCGGLLDWMSGRNRRAPKWMIRAGLEWLWRLMIEPRRLMRRYVIGNPVFLYRLARAIRRSPGRRSR